MDSIIIQTDMAPASIGPYSQGIVVNGWLFISGQLGIKPETGELAGPGIAAQTNQALENIKHILSAERCDFDHVVSVDVFLTNMGDFDKFNEIYLKYFPRNRPARAVAEVSALPKGGCIEIKCIAVQR